MVASGTVDIYDIADLSNPIDTRRCSVSINFYDEGGDACSGEPGGFYSWGPPYHWDKMERFYHLHQVSGVYTRLAWVRNDVGWGKVTVFTHPPTIFDSERMSARDLSISAFSGSVHGAKSDYMSAFLANIDVMLANLPSKLHVFYIFFV